MHATLPVRPLRTLAALGTAIACTSGAHASILGCGVGGRIFDVDTSIGAASNGRDTNHRLVDIEYGPAGQLYGLTDSGNFNIFCRINAITGQPTSVGNAGFAVIEGDLAYDASTGTMYAVQSAPTSSNRGLYSMSLLNGAGTLVASIDAPGSDLSALAFDGAGALWALDTANERVLRIDKLSGAVLSSTSLNVALGVIAGMVYNPADGKLYVADGNTDGTDSLYSLDTATGVLSFIGPTGLGDGASGLAAIPAPGALPLLACALLAPRRSRR